MTTETPAPPSRERKTVWLVTEEQTNPSVTFNIVGVFSTEARARAYASTLVAWEANPGDWIRPEVEAFVVDEYAALLAAEDVCSECGGRGWNPGRDTPFEPCPTCNAAGDAGEVVE